MRYLLTAISMTEYTVMRRQSTVKNVGDRHSHSSLEGMKNGKATLESSLAFKTKDTLIKQVTNSAPWYLLKDLTKLVSTQSCSWIFLLALFIFIKT